MNKSVNVSEKNRKLKKIPHCHFSNTQEIMLRNTQTKDSKNCITEKYKLRPCN
jgi:hypothetical protein